TATDVPDRTRPITIRAAANSQDGAKSPRDGSAGPQNQATAPWLVVHHPGDLIILLAASSMYGMMKAITPRSNATTPEYSKRLFVVLLNFHHCDRSEERSKVLPVAPKLVHEASKDRFGRGNFSLIATEV